ncbi:MAG: type II toxin-antitoxin system MqsR family toxin, partial [Deltaproteobacteria bacterium]|nr:type II toxin-antitoxin system MqsR family toxin [Deltaproteobacteria bacterium]
MTKSKQPTYDLEELKNLVQNEKTRIITRISEQGANAINFSITELIETVLDLKSSDFYKTMRSEKVANTWQDVYFPVKKNLKLYVKLQMSL